MESVSCPVEALAKVPTVPSSIPDEAACEVEVMTSSDLTIEDNNGPSESMVEPQTVDQVDHSEAHMLHVDHTCHTVSFSVGESFETFEKLERKIKEYEQARSVQLWRRDSRTVDAARRRVDRPINSRLKYYEIVYACINGGKKFKTKGQGRRASS